MGRGGRAQAPREREVGSGALASDKKSKRLTPSLSFVGSAEGCGPSPLGRATGSMQHTPRFCFSQQGEVGKEARGRVIPSYSSRSAKR